MGGLRRLKRAAVILAAGRGRRFGDAVKQLAALDGEPMIRRVARTTLEAGFSPVVVVLGARAARIEPALADLPVVIARNAAHADGVSTSIRCGLQRAADADEVAIVLGDQPLVPSAHLRRLSEQRRARNAAIAATAFRDENRDVTGAPAVFDRSQFAALEALDGDRGAGALIRASSEVARVRLDAAALDVDTADDLASARASQRRQR